MNLLTDKELDDLRLSYTANLYGSIYASEKAYIRAVIVAHITKLTGVNMEPVAIAECNVCHGQLCQFLNRSRHGMDTLKDGDKLYTAIQLAVARVQAIADEREACAKICEGRLGGAVQTNDWWSGFKTAMKQCAEVIRARTTQEPKP